MMRRAAWYAQSHLLDQQTVTTAPAAAPSSAVEELDDEELVLPSASPKASRGITLALGHRGCGSPLAPEESRPQHASPKANRAAAAAATKARRTATSTPPPHDLDETDSMAESSISSWASSPREQGQQRNSGGAVTTMPLVPPTPPRLADC